MTAWQRALGPAHPRVAVAAANLGQALRFQQKYAEAAQHFEQALEILRTAGPGTDRDRIRCLANFADLTYQQGSPARAVDLYRQALTAAREAYGEDHPETALLMTRLAEVRRGQGLYAESVKLYRRALPILEASRQPQDDDLRDVRRKYDAVLRESARTMLIAR
jgi:tetratricopeptide (TPR) repeat protein